MGRSAYAEARSTEVLPVPDLLAELRQRRTAAREAANAILTRTADEAAP
jgi:hypothetical protein